MNNDLKLFIKQKISSCLETCKNSDFHIVDEKYPSLKIWCKYEEFVNCMIDIFLDKFRNEKFFDAFIDNFHINPRCKYSDSLSSLNKHFERCIDVLREL